MEMGQVEFYYRLVSLRCRELGVFIPYTKIDRGRLDDNEMNTVTQAIEDLKQLPILIDDTPGLTPLIFKSKLLKYINDDGVQSAWLDYIQIGNNEGKGGKTTADQISGSMTEYKNVTKDLNIPIGILSQIDKNVENNGQNGRPLFVNLKGSGSLGEASDVVILLHRPEVYDPEPVNEEGVSEKGVMYIDVVKNKMGDMGLIKELFSVSTNYLEKENPWVQSSPAVVVGNAINHYGRVKQDYNIDDDVPF
jgi:replicative DNA helicase